MQNHEETTIQVIQPKNSRGERYVRSIVLPTSGEIPSDVLDVIDLAVDSVQEGYTPEATDILMSEAQLRAIRRSRLI